MEVVDVACVSHQMGRNPSNHPTSQQRHINVFYQAQKPYNDKEKGIETYFSTRKNITVG
jgi:hypothetical protein